MSSSPLKSISPICLTGYRLEDPEAGEYRVKLDAATNTIRVIPAEPGVLPSPIYPGLRTNLPKVSTSPSLCFVPDV